MNRITRFSGSSLLAIGVTFTLCIMMAAMITVEFAPQPDVKESNFDLNPAAEDIAPPERGRKIKPYKRVETPPAPPKTGTTPSGPVSVGPAEILGDKGDYTLPSVDFDMPVISVSDTNATPILRPPPIMPPRAERSGHCRVVFDVAPEGAPFNIQTPYCTDRVFKSATIKAVQKWRFAPKREGGRAVTMRGVQNQITFRLEDEHGNPIPE